MKRFLVPLLIAALVCLCFPAAAEGDTLAFDPAASQISEGETLQTVLVREGGAADGEVAYTSSDTRTAVVDANGVVTALKKGRAVITATVKGAAKTYKAQMKITVVRPVASISVKTGKLSVYDAADEKVAPYLSARENADENALPVLILPVRKKIQLSAAVEPKDATNRNVTLTSSDPAVFSTARNSIAGTAPGDAILTVASESNPEVNTRFRVLVVQPVTKLTVEASASSVAVGGQVTLTATASPDNATVKTVAWSSGTEKILKVEDGVATGIKRGNGRVIAASTDGSNVRANYSLKVVQLPESISFSVEELTIDIGRTKAAKATVQPRDTDNKKLTWSSSDESIATVDKNGRIKGLAVGECTITATCDADANVSAALTVHVQKPVKKIAFDGKIAYAYLGETTQLSWTVEPADATNQKLAFKSARESIVTVDENGVVTGVSSGKAYVNAVTTDGSNRKARIMVHAGRHVSGVHMLRRCAYIDPGETATAGAVIEPKDAINHNMTWSSSDDGVVSASGNTNHKMKIHGNSHGEATITGVTEDGGFETSIRVRVGDYDHGITFRDFGFNNSGHFWLKVKNNTDMPITEIKAELEVFDPANPGDGITINKKTGSNKIDMVWTGRLMPGETTGKENWKMINFICPNGGMKPTSGTVTVYCYQIDNDWVKTIRKAHRKTMSY